MKSIWILSVFFGIAAAQDLFLARNPPGASSKAEMFQKLMTGRSNEKEWTVDDWKSEEKNSFLHERGFEVQTTTYTSPPMAIQTGGSFFAFPINTRVPWPKGNYTIMKTDFKIIDDLTNASDVPLSEVYMHHWLIGAAIVFPNADLLGPCEGSLFYGAGAELRGMSYAYPEGYGMKRIDASGECSANLHLLRTQDLNTSWDGLNDPKGNKYAAVKNCVECGYAPGRASECKPINDGTFGCCFSDSRCPVNNPKDISTKTYHLQYEVQWTRDLTKLKHLTTGFVDIRNILTITEWNVAPNMKSHPHPFIPSGNQKCNATVCVDSNYWIVGERAGAGAHLCPGRMLWSYTHMHTGAISSTMRIDGVPHCQTLPVYGTDPKNPPGNEKGYVVSFKPCVDNQTKGNGVHLKKGQRIDVDAVYDVDPISTRSAPLPSGKHGGVMALFYYYMDCDPGSTEEEFVCRNKQCILVPARGTYSGKNSRAKCEEQCAGKPAALSESVLQDGIA
jgi:hypothetical protein